MDGPVLIGALLGITCVVSRPMLRAFGSGPVATATPAPWRRSRLEEMLSRYDWEMLLGLRYETDRPGVADSSSDGVPNTVPTETAELPGGNDEALNSERFLLDRLEAELVRATVEAVLDGLSFFARREPVVARLPVEFVADPVEQLINVPPPKDRPGRFGLTDLQAGLPVGAPDLVEVLVPSTAAKARSVPARVRVKEAFAGQPVGAPSWMESDRASESIAVAIPVEASAELIPMQDVVVLAHFAALDEAVGQPVGAPSCHDWTVQPRRVGAETGNVTTLDFQTVAGDEEYRIAASMRKAGEVYAIAAYSLNAGANNASSAGDDGEDHDSPDPLEELLDQILEPPAPEKDPNELELPLELEGSRRSQPSAAGLPVGAPDWFAIVLPLPTVETPAEMAAEIVTDPEADDDDEASAPVAREINRISERVEHILSSALARPAPAINFNDALADITDRSRQRKSAAEPTGERLPSPALEDNLARSGNRDGGLSMAEYKVQFEIFEGPLDLLLYLVRKQEVDIYEVNLTQIAGEFIRYIEMMRQFDLEVAGEFLVMASTLMYIKSKELLPVEQQSQLEDEDEEDDPRWELIRQLVEYKKFKDAAAGFKKLELAQEDVFPRNPAKPDFPVQELRPNVSVFDLIGAVNKILERIDAKEEREIFADRWTVSEKIEVIRAEILKRESVRFTELFEDALSRTEVVATFLAVLELIKLKVIVVEQPNHFTDIEIRKSPPGHRLNLDEAQAEMALENAGSEYDEPAGEPD